MDFILFRFAKKLMFAIYMEIRSSVLIWSRFDPGKAKKHVSYTLIWSLSLLHFWIILFKSGPYMIKESLSTASTPNCQSMIKNWRGCIIMKWSLFTLHLFGLLWAYSDMKTNNNSCHWGRYSDHVIWIYYLMTDVDCWWADELKMIFLVLDHC